MRHLLTLLAITTSTLAPTAALAETKIWYQPQATMVNNFRYEMQKYEDEGRFSFYYMDPKPCADSYVDTQIEGKTLVVNITSCLGDKLFGRYTTLDWFGKFVKSDDGQLATRAIDSWVAEFNQPDKIAFGVEVRVKDKGVIGTIRGVNRRMIPLAPERAYQVPGRLPWTEIYKNHPRRKTEVLPPSPRQNS